MRLWVTRSQPGASRTAARLRELGHAPLVGPLLELRRLPASPGALDGACAYAFSSAAGVEAAAALAPDLSRPAFAVGDATAAAARAAGFRDVRSAGGDGLALARLLARDAPGLAAGPVLAPGAREPAFDLPAALAPRGVEVRPVPLYASEPVRAWPPAARAALDERALEGVLLHSPAASGVLAGLLAADPERAAAFAGVRVFALSPACAAPLSGLAEAPRFVAPHPSEAALLSLLSPPPAPPLSPPPDLR